jgi:nucleoside 2-deoxyribosyltransferase
MKVYLAHPISGLSYEDVVSYYEEMTKRLKNWGFEILCPMTAKGYLRTERTFKAHGYDNPVSTNHAIFERDCWMVKQSDILLCDFTDTKDASIGCCMELAWASMLGKHTVIVLPEENIHRHAFVLESSDIVFDKMDDAIYYLGYLITGRIE